MQCNHCSAKLPAGAKFCLNCGSPVGAGQAAPSLATPNSAQPFSAYQSSPLPSKWLLAGLLLLAGGVAGAMYWQGSKVTGAAGQSGIGSLVEAPGASKKIDMVQAPGDTPKNEMVQAPGETKERPLAIEDYLKFLKEIENTKQALIGRALVGELKNLTQVQGLSASIDDETFNQTYKDTNKTIDTGEDDWNKLTTLFQAKTPPPACMELHDKYYDSLGKLETLMMQVKNFLNTKDLGVAAMSGKASQEMDEAFKKADDSLADVCAKAGIRKDFEIRGDPSNSGSMFH